MESRPTRRELLGYIASLTSLSALPACVSAGIPPAPIRTNLVDVHCHVFNASDLPVTRFIRYVFLHDTPEQSEPRARRVEDPDFVDGLLQLFEAIVVGQAPTARQEIEVLDGMAAAEVGSASAQAAGEDAVARTAEFLRVDSSIRPRSGRTTASRDRVRAAILDAAGARGRSLQLETLRNNETEDVARRAYLSLTNIGSYLRWFALFRRYRYSLVDQLVDMHERQGFRPLLIAPALIDYSAWLQETPESSLRSQMEVMGRIASRRSGPPVHGYMAYDPLSEVDFRRNGGASESSLDLVREALTKHGFLGVKLYPPMGFKPFGNSNQQYPKKAADRIGPTISTDLNMALADLYDLCVELKAPILAHAAESNGVVQEYAKRADPAYWLDVFRRWPDLHVCLAHFGRFSYKSAARPPGSQSPENSWEWTLGRFLRANPERPVFADVSYLSEVLDAPPDRREFYASRLKRFIREFDPDVHHLMFGTDWVMLGAVRNHQTYTQQVVQFFEKDCDLDSTRLERLLSINAVRFLGLRDNDGSRRRLLSFYRQRMIPAERLPRFSEASA